MGLNAGSGFGTLFIGPVLGLPWRSVYGFRA